MSKTIAFSSWPAYTEEEGDAVRRVLLSNRVNQWTGGETFAFEREFAAWVGSRYAIALANGTLALELALVALGIGPGDDVVVTPRTFIASVSSIVSVGARPVFADVDRDTQNLSAATIEAALTPATKAIVVVHLAGMPADMDAIGALARRHGLKVVEDCAQAHGATWNGRPVGTFGDVGAWSFCQDKIMTTGGEGGMVTTDDEASWRRMWAYKDHGKSYEAFFERGHSASDPCPWPHESFGTNWRMTEMQSAIGRLQIARMPEWHARRLANARAVWDACRGVDWLRVPDVPPAAEHAAYKCYAFVRPERMPPGWTRDRIIEALAAEGVPVGRGSCAEVYLEKAFDDTGWRPGAPLPTARELGETSLMFLVHPTLTDLEIARTRAAVETVDAAVRASAMRAPGCDSCTDGASAGDAPHR